MTEWHYKWVGGNSQMPRNDVHYIWGTKWTEQQVMSMVNWQHECIQRSSGISEWFRVEPRVRKVQNLKSTWKAQFERFSFFWISVLKKSVGWDNLGNGSGRDDRQLYFLGGLSVIGVVNKSVLDQWAPVSRDLSTTFLPSVDMMICRPVFLGFCTAWGGKRCAGIWPFLPPLCTFPFLPLPLKTNEF